MNELLTKFKALGTPYKAAIVAVPLILLSCLCCVPLSIVGYLGMGNPATVDAGQLADNWRDYQGRQVILADTPYARVDNKLMFYRENRSRFKVWATGEFGTAERDQPIRIQGNVLPRKDGKFVIELADCKVVK